LASYTRGEGIDRRPGIGIWPQPQRQPDLPIGPQRLQDRPTKRIWPDLDSLEPHFRVQGAHAHETGHFCEER